MTNARTMSVAETNEIVERYFASSHEDVGMMAEDVVFRIMATGEEHRGPAAVLAMLHHFYRGGSFEADAERRNVVVSEGKAVWEGDFVGRHVGEFAGVPATGKDVRVPFAVAYDLRDGQIVEGRVYFEVPVFLAQVGALG